MNFFVNLLSEFLGRTSWYHCHKIRTLRTEFLGECTAVINACYVILALLRTSGNSSIASKTICQKRNLFPQLNKGIVRKNPIQLDIFILNKIRTDDKYVTNVITI